MVKCFQLADFDEVTTMCAAAKHCIANDRQGERDPLEFFMELINLSDVSKPVMNRHNDIGESVIQIGVGEVYYASSTVDRHTGHGGVEGQPCAVPVHVSVKSHLQVPSEGAARPK